VSDVPERWSKAGVYPDMWADPGEDPRNSDGVSPDGELPTLRDFLGDYRLTLRMKCEGLSPEQLARRPVPPSTMSLLGLVRHLKEGIAIRELWVHRIDEYARHCGHADLLRECIDGRVGQ
jgi:hypothetical protein